MYIDIDTLTVEPVGPVDPPPIDPPPIDPPPIDPPPVELPPVVYSYQSTYGSSGFIGTGDNEFHQPWGVGFDSARRMMAVADAHNHRVQLQIFQWDSGMNRYVYHSTVAAGGQGVGDHQLTAPRAVGFDSARGLLAVADTGNSRVQFFQWDSDSSRYLYRSTLGGFGSDDNQLNFPCGVSFDSGRDVMAVADAYNHRVQLFKWDTNANNYVYHSRLGVTGPVLEDQALTIFKVLLVWALTAFVAY
jgi:hypothetical protein